MGFREFFPCKQTLLEKPQKAFYSPLFVPPAPGPGDDTTVRYVGGGGGGGVLRLA